MIGRLLMGTIGLVLVACQGKTPESMPSEMKGSGLLCRADYECTAGWHPMMEDCGSIERCVDGVCSMPPAVTGKVSKALTGRLEWRSMGEMQGADEAHDLQVEIVSEPFETARGMMCRTSMVQGYGMLFLMPSTKRQSFWMKNTLMSLDMVFIDEDWRVVGLVSNVPPKNLESRSVVEPSHYVLELAAGEAARLNLKVGQQLQYRPPVSSHP